MHRYDPIGSPRFRRAALVAVLAAGPALAAVAPVLAAEAKPRSAFADTTKPVLFLKETVVTGARYPRAYFESPQSLSFVSRQVLREQTPLVLGDVLATLPGVDSNKDSPWEQRPSIRGLTGQRVLVLVDGSPMNSVRGNGPHPSLLDPTQVERIEVVRGPSSVAYGSDALGGVINIITREPRFLGADEVLHGSASLGGSASGLPERNGSLEFSTRCAEALRLLLGQRSQDRRFPERGREGPALELQRLERAREPALRPHRPSRAQGRLPAVPRQGHRHPGPGRRRCRATRRPSSSRTTTATTRT